jgi:hypothetical protein
MSVTEYQATLRELRAASDEWKVLGRRLAATAKLIETGNPVAFMMDPQPQAGMTDYARSSAPYRESEWPTAEQIAIAARRLDAAEKAAGAAWTALPADDKIGLQAPPKRR